MATSPLRAPGPAGAMASGATRLRLSVLIPTWRRPQTLASCLAGLAEQQRRPEEVLVVVRSDDRATREYLAASAVPDLPIRQVDPLVSGVVAALNAGLAEVTGDVVAITDDDVVPRRAWLGQIESRLLARPGVGGLGGRDWVHQGGTVERGSESTVGVVTRMGRVVGNHHLGFGGPREVDILKGTNMAFRTKAVTGLRIDSELRSQGTHQGWEADLCLAVLSRGWKLEYDPEVAVDHHVAQRPVGQREGQWSLRERRDEAFNELYVLVKRLPADWAVRAVVYHVLIGSRAAPGPVLALERIAAGHDPGDVTRRLSACLMGRSAAVVAGLRARHRTRSTP